MEPKVSPYDKGKIYKITYGDFVYYGSTCQTLSRRLTDHKKDYKRWKDGKLERFTTALSLFDNNQNPIITLVEDFPCARKEQLLQRERFYIETNNCLNRVIPIRSKEEQTQIMHQYYNENKNIIKQRAHDYYIQNKESVNQRNKEYTMINDVKTKEYQKKYREQNKDKIREYKKNYYLLKNK